MNCGPVFSGSFANMVKQPPGGGQEPPSGPRQSQQGQRNEPRKSIAIAPNKDEQLNKAEIAWKPVVTKTRGEEEDLEAAKTQELFQRVRSILDNLTLWNFSQLMKQVRELRINTEERLKGVVELIYEKAISEPSFSIGYANMCHGLIGLKVPASYKTGATVNFRKMLLNRCKKDFEKDTDEIFEQKQKELDAAIEKEDRQRLDKELKDAMDKAHCRSLGNVKFIGELFKLKMLTENIMHDCIVKLLKNDGEKRLECLCCLLSTIGKDLDLEKVKPRMDQYFHKMEKIIKERKTSSRIRFMVHDVLNLRQNNWVPKTNDQIQKKAGLGEHREQLLSKKDVGRRRGGRMSQPDDVDRTPQQEHQETVRAETTVSVSEYLDRGDSCEDRDTRLYCTMGLDCNK